MAKSKIFSNRKLCDNLVKKLLPPLVPKHPTRRLQGRRRSTTTKRRLGETPAPQLAVSIWLTLPVWYATVEIKKMQTTPFVITIIRNGILQGTVSNLQRTRATQKTNISLSYFYSITDTSWETSFKRVMWIQYPV